MRDRIRRLSGDRPPVSPDFIPVGAEFYSICVDEWWLFRRVSATGNVILLDTNNESSLNNRGRTFPAIVDHSERYYVVLSRVAEKKDGRWVLNTMI